MSNFDTKLERMTYLMGYDNHINESKKSNGIEYHTTGADGKEYGIIKEGVSYYIKTSTPDKAELVESYNYINGYDYRKENRYNSYNEATKQLELKLMNINESKGVHKDVTVANLNASTEAFQGLTETARKELDRMHLIFENSFISKDNIGNHGDPESKGISTGTNTTVNCDPFSEKTDAELDKDKTTNATKDNACKDCKETGEPKMDNLENPQGGTAKDDNEKAKVDLDGESVATMEKKGADTVKMNESEENPFDTISGDEETSAPEEKDIDTLINSDEVENTPNNDELVGDPESSEAEGDLDDLLREYEEVIFGNNDTLEGKQNIKGSESPISTDNLDNIKIQKGCEDGCEKTMSGKQEGTLPVQTCDNLNESKKSKYGKKVKWNKQKINESINRITDTVYDNLMMEDVKKTVKRIVKEEMTKLNVWGKHPRYGKPFMSTPDNKEVMRGTADRDFNDDSAKGNAVYGTKRGNSAPFDEKTVNLLIDAVVNTIKEGSIFKKKQNDIIDQIKPTEIGSSNYGLTPICKNNRYNYIIDKEDRLLSEYCWFDYAKPFRKYLEGNKFGIVGINNTSYYINTNGLVYHADSLANYYNSTGKVPPMDEWTDPVYEMRKNIPSTTSKK